LGVCATCKAAKPTIHKLPCVRYILTDCKLYRVSNFGFTKRFPELKMQDITGWASADIRMSILRKANMPGFGIRLKFRKFVPIEGDQLERHWVDGKTKKSAKIEPYAFADMEETAQEFRRVVDETAFEWIDKLLANSDPLIQKTYTMAKQYLFSAPVSFVSMAHVLN
jgi:hypothetical protein